MFTPGIHRFYIRSEQTNPVASIPLLREAAPEQGAAALLTDFAERLAAALTLIATGPVLCCSAAILAALSGRSPLIAHRRVGRHGAALWMLKLRTMWETEPGANRHFAWIEYIDDPGGPLEKDSGDPRIPHAFARFCRRHSIDELPQLLHVLLGEMSLVGPRPLTSLELDRYYGPDQPEILAVKPGIAGLWQISGRNRLTYAERRKLDLHLVRHRSWRLSLRILVRSFVEVWRGGNAW
jgi:exopolysaccharide production protein ExoY